MQLQNHPANQSTDPSDLQLICQSNQQSVTLNNRSMVQPKFTTPSAQIGLADCKVAAAKLLGATPEAIDLLREACGSFVAALRQPTKLGPL